MGGRKGEEGRRRGGWGRTFHESWSRSMYGVSLCYSTVLDVEDEEVIFLYIVVVA